MVNEFPEQIDPLLTEIVGVAFTEILDTAVLVQPCALVPVMV